MHSKSYYWIMSNTISKVIVLIAIFCYLSASSIASAHGGSWMVDNPGSTSTNSSLVNNDSLENSMLPSCHNKGGNAGSQANVGCELLCSVIGHVMLDFYEPLINPSEPKLEAPSLLADLITRQSIVEKRPPK